MERQEPCLKDKFIDKQYATPEKLYSQMETIISEIVSDPISRLFVTWQARLETAVICEGPTFSE
jgi:hypothetical protein